MKIVADNCDKLTREAQFDLLNRIIIASQAVDKENPEDGSIIETILICVIEGLDELDQEDSFGTEGWRHSILGED